MKKYFISFLLLLLLSGTLFGQQEDNNQNIIDRVDRIIHFADSVTNVYQNADAVLLLEKVLSLREKAVLFVNSGEIKKANDVITKIRALADRILLLQIPEELVRIKFRSAKAYYTTIYNEANAADDNLAKRLLNECRQYLRKAKELFETQNYIKAYKFINFSNEQSLTALLLVKDVKRQSEMNPERLEKMEAGLLEKKTEYGKTLRKLNGQLPEDNKKAVNIFGKAKKSFDWFKLLLNNKRYISASKKCSIIEKNLRFACLLILPEEFLTGEFKQIRKLFNVLKMKADSSGNRRIRKLLAGMKELYTSAEKAFTDKEYDKTFKILNRLRNKLQKAIQHFSEDGKSDRPEKPGVTGRNARLNQNSPNPFNPVTNISFEITKSGYITLKIYDILGREIKSLISGNLSAGNHIFNWNGTDSHGNVVASGPYYYVLDTGNEKLTRAMYFVK